MKHMQNIEPWLYHLHNLHQTEDIAFWKDLAADLDRPILDLGCGTGRVLVPLVKAGHKIIGLDINFAYLEYLQDHLEEQYKSKVRLIQGNFSAFHFSQTFGLIFMACNTLSMIEVDRRKETFSRIHSHLAPGGLFVASIPNPVLLSSLPAAGESEVEASLIHPKSGNPIQVSSEWQRLDQGRIGFRWSYDHLLPDGRVERISVESIHTLTDIEEYNSELESVGLAIRAVYGDFRRSAYNNDSPYLIMLVE
jgi:SAM-dependent methyltransferase